MTAMTPAALLNAAADLIDARGLAAGVEEDDEGRLCPIGALRTAAYGRADVPFVFVAANIDAYLPAGFVPANVRSYWDAWEALVAYVAVTGRDVASWVDASTQDVVTAGLRAAAATVEGTVPA